MHWNKGVPIMVNLLAWKAHLGRLPTANALAKRGLKQPIYAFSVKDLLQIHMRCQGSVRKKEAIHDRMETVISGNSRGD
ncbi:hypothetical protein R6Q57_017472 [Mikania cordata]